MDVVYIEPDNELLDLDSVNCLEIAVCYCLRNIEAGYEAYFLLLIKFLQSYFVSKEKNDMITYPVEMDGFLREQLKRMKISVTEKNTISNYESFIRMNLKQNNLIFASGDLKGLYYTDYYKTESKRHVFLINGYEESRQLFHIIDCMQDRNKKKKYRNFYITQEQLKQMMIEYEKNYKKMFLCSLTAQSNRINKEKAVNDILEYYVKNKLKPREFFYLRELKQEKKQQRGKIEGILRIQKYKKMFLLLLLYFIKKESGKNGECEQAEWNIIRNLDKEKKILENCLIDYYKGNTEKIRKATVEMKSIERQLKQQIEKVKDGKEKYSFFGRGTGLLL